MANIEEKTRTVLKALIQCGKGPEFKEDCGDCPYVESEEHCIARLCHDAYTVITKMQQLLDLMEEIKRPEKLKRTIDALRCCVKDMCSDECPMRDRDWIASGKATCREFQDGDTLEIPRALILTAIELLEKLDGGADGGDA